MVGSRGPIFARCGTVGNSTAGAGRGVWENPLPARAPERRLGSRRTARAIAVFVIHIRRRAARPFLAGVWNGVKLASGAAARALAFLIFPPACPGLFGTLRRGGAADAPAKALPTIYRREGNGRGALGRIHGVDSRWCEVYDGNYETPSKPSQARLEQELLGHPIWRWKSGGKLHAAALCNAPAFLALNAVTPSCRYGRQRRIEHEKAVPSAY